ncbi:MAG TPA: hypothetical protein VEC11_13895 [Allosphingosinicella sp.]|nr:hypothetical protein [Allosphingosinicella sp.]
MILYLTALAAIGAAPAPVPSTGTSPATPAPAVAPAAPSKPADLAVLPGKKAPLPAGTLVPKPKEKPAKEDKPLVEA